jgi:hypothetical protein
MILYAQPTATGYQLIDNTPSGIEVIENFTELIYCH